MKLLPFGGSFIYNIPPLVELMASFPCPKRNQGWSWAVSGPYQLRNRFGQKYLYVEMVRSK